MNCLRIDGSHLPPEFVSRSVDDDKGWREPEIETLSNSSTHSFLDVQANHDQFVCMLVFDPIHDGFGGLAGQSEITLKLEQHRLTAADLSHHLLGLV